jgi:hypothetical protein
MERGHADLNSSSYYICSDRYYTGKVSTYVPEHELQALLDEINRAFPDADIRITNEMREDGMVLNFDGLPDELRPRWLGKSKCREQFKVWSESAPVTTRADSTLDHGSLKAFKAMIDATYDLAKAKGKAKKSVSRQSAVQKRQDMTKQINRGQRYLGLRSKPSDDLIQDLAGLSVKSIDPSVPAPHPFDEDAIIIAFDAEAYERPPHVVTEVGVATLDTRDLCHEPPGVVGEHWQKYVRARHFRVIEYKHLCNHDFVTGCPDRFEFGNSELVGQINLASVLTSCFHQPFSKRDSAGSLLSRPEEEERRNIILLGHDITQDIGYLESIGFNPLNRGNILEVMDTATMFRSYTGDINPTSLGGILSHFDLDAWHLHNAGNDAMYTIWAMLAICVKGNERAESKGGVGEEATGGVGLPVMSQTKDDAIDMTATPSIVYGPPRPPSPPASRLYTSGGVPLDV